MRSLRKLAVTAITAVVALSVAGAPAHATARPRVRDVAGTKLVSATIHTKSGPAQVWYEQIDLTNAHLRVEPVLAGNLLNTNHETVPAMAQRTHAVVGLNGDFWNWSYPNAGPLHGLWMNKHMFKTPGYRTSANFYTTTDGKAHVGPVKVSTEFTWRGAHSKLQHAYAFSVNNVDDILRHHLVLTTNDLAAISLPSNCTVAYLNSTTGGGWKVARTVTKVKSLPRRLSNQRALVACRTTMPLKVGNVVHWTQTSTVNNIDGLISGGAQLVRNGRAFRDPAAQLATSGLNPMTFVCVAKDSRHITLGVVDGRRHTSVGINPTLLTSYLRALGGCWNAMSFDGGGSTTLWARGKVQNVPSDGKPRSIVDGLFIYRH
jgi:exopolysaccharide biosynthesis protein